MVCGRSGRQGQPPHVPGVPGSVTSRPPIRSVASCVRRAHRWSPVQNRAHLTAFHTPCPIPGLAPARPVRTQAPLAAARFAAPRAHRQDWRAEGPTLRKSRPIRPGLNRARLTTLGTVAHQAKPKCRPSREPRHPGQADQGRLAPADQGEADAGHAALTAATELSPAAGRDPKPRVEPGS